MRAVTILQCVPFSMIQRLFAISLSRGRYKRDMFTGNKVVERLYSLMCLNSSTKSAKALGKKNWGKKHPQSHIVDLEEVGECN